MMRMTTVVPSAVKTSVVNLCSDVHFLTSDIHEKYVHDEEELSGMCTSGLFKTGFDELVIASMSDWVALKMVSRDFSRTSWTSSTPDCADRYILSGNERKFGGKSNGK